jgi:Mn2+/Fe2+ NRAMP family transporter
MKNALKVALGILTSIGGFLDVGAIATAAQAGAKYRFGLIWAILLGTLCVIFLVEMSGRLAAVSGHPLAGAVRERFGINFQFLPLCAELIVDFLVLAAEIGGVALALQLVTGISFRWWALPVGFVVWLVLWVGKFNIIEDGVALLGLITLVFVIAAFKLHPPLSEVVAGVIPRNPPDHPASYWFIAVSILGAIISPYLFFFYSSGAVEEKWNKKDLGANRVVAVVGMGFGSVVALGVLIVAAMTLAPGGIEVERYEDASRMLDSVFGRWGLALFAASLFIACFGAALEVSLDTAYLTSQVFGWNWGESLKPAKDARFSSVYTFFILGASILMTVGPDPLTLTVFAMALTALILPVVIFPFLILMNDRHYLGEHTNGWFSNAVVVVVITLSFILALVSIPLQLWGN